MNQDEGTGGNMLIAGHSSSYAAIGHGSRSGGAGAPNIETAGSRSTGEENRNAAAPRVTKASKLRRMAARTLHRRRASLKACLTDLERIQTLGDNLIAKSNCIADIQKHLRSLWDDVEGDSDSEAFEEIINALRVAFADDDPRSLSEDQLGGLRSAILAIYEEPDVNDALANDLTEELLRHGIDLFRELG
jgi:phosphatidylserine/phosphatidylglycerophosphate/cardiolipin synthase-like enzyme